MKDWRGLMKERGTRNDMPMKPQVVTYELNKLLDDDAIVSSDSGTIATWSARYIDIRDRMQFSLSGSLATMANGLPYSIGAAVAYPERQVVCVVGDGGFTMLMGEIATLVKYNLPVKVIIIKNNVLGEIKWEQMVLRGQSAVRRRAAADRLRRLRQRLRRRRLHDREARRMRRRFSRRRSPIRGPRSSRPSSIPTSRRCRARSRWSRRCTSPRRWRAESTIAGTSSRRCSKTRSARSSRPCRRLERRASVPIDRRRRLGVPHPHRCANRIGWHVRVERNDARARRGARRRRHGDRLHLRRHRDRAPHSRHARRRRARPRCAGDRARSGRRSSPPSATSAARASRRWRSRRSTWRSGISRRGCSTCRSSRCSAPCRDAVPVYGSGGFTSYSLDQLREQLSCWVQMRHAAREDEDRPRSGGRRRARRRGARGDRRRRRAVRRRQRRLRPQAGAVASRAVRASRG